MPSRAVQISIDADLLRLIDNDPETKQQGRSAFVRRAVRLYMEAKERGAVDAAILRAYGGKRDRVFREIEDIRKVQAWPEK